MRIEKRVEKLERANIARSDGVRLSFFSFVSPEEPEGLLSFAVVIGLGKQLNRQDEETEAEFAQRVCSEFVDFHGLADCPEQTLSQEDANALRASMDADFAFTLAKSTKPPDDGGAETEIGRSDNHD